MKIKKGDLVMVIAGKDRGKRGLVERSLPKEGKIIIAGINLAKHHLKPTRKNPHGGILDVPAAIDASNVQLVCPHCGRPIRVAHKVGAEVKERVCRKCQGNLEVKEKNVKS